jgi:signal transduction histidine kinase
VRLSEIAIAPRSPFELSGAIRDAIASTQRSSSSTSIQLGLSNALPQVLGHRDRAVNVFVNLFRNSVQDVPEGTAQIQVEGRLGSDSKHIEVFVDDNGPGIPQERRQTVFEEGVSFRPEGTGLGLAFVRETVKEDLEGEVWIEESPSGGARIVLKIPVMGAAKS